MSLKSPDFNFTSNLTLKTTGWIITISFIAMTFIPRSFDDTLFVDGLAYAAISRNMAIGQGSFWQPHFADSFWLSFNDRCFFFCEHPPLMFGIQSLFFKIFGDTTFVENFYNLIVLIANVFLINLIWKKLFIDHNGSQNTSWLPVLFWYSLRIVWWSVPNNLLDTTMTVFCLSSCYFQLKAFTATKFVTHYWIASGLMVVLACMTKGPVGLFPLAFAGIYNFVYGRNFIRAAVLGTSIVLSTYLLLMFLILQYPPANYFLKNYFQGQVVAALFKKREKVSNDWTAHFYLLRLLFINVIPHLILVLGLLATNFYNKLGTKISDQTKKICLLTFLLTTSVVLPMLASVKQADYYLMPALPFVGLFFAACSIDLLTPIKAKFPFLTQISLLVASLFFLIVMCYKIINPETDHMYQISKKLTQYIPPNAKIYLPNKIANYSEIHTPFQRYSRLSIAYSPKDSKYLFFDNTNNTLLDSIKQTNSYRIIDLGNDATLAIRNESKAP